MLVYDGPNGSLFISILLHNSEFRILNSEFRNLHCEFLNSEFGIDLFHIVSAHAYIGHVARYFPIIGETLQRWGKRILSH